MSEWVDGYSLTHSLAYPLTPIRVFVVRDLAVPSSRYKED
jgi:hypothetical protein